MSSRRDRSTQYSMGQPAIPDAVAVVSAHSPHQLSMIEEVSRETLTTVEDRDKGASGDYLPEAAFNHLDDQIYDSSDVLEEYMQGIEYEGYDDGNSNVGPHGQHGLAQNTAETVLYGDWEQDNNLDDLNRCTTPDTVIHYELDGAQGAYETSTPSVSAASSSTASYRHYTHRGPIAYNATSTMGESSKAKDWSMLQSNLVDYGPFEPSPRLPGCSAGHPFKKSWKLSDSMMMAYNAMRGPMTVPGNDPLRNWMVIKANESINESAMKSEKQAQQAEQTKNSEDGTHSLQSGKGIANNGAGGQLSSSHGKKLQSSPSKVASQPSSMTHEEKVEMEDYAKMLKEANMAAREYAPAEEDRRPVYQVPRPRYLHVSPKFKGFTFADYVPPEADVPESAYKQPYDPARNFEEEYDISDDEGDPESGRLSPCTFRLFAEGCSRTEPKANQVFMADDAQRMRPPTPLEDRFPRISIDRLAVSFELQRDTNDGGWITPCYSVDSEPSIIYRPPGVSLKHKMRNWWFGLFDRMDPIAARRFRKIQFREATDPATPLETSSERSALSSSSTSEEGRQPTRPYTEAEVLEALNSPNSRRVAGVAAKNAQLIISQRWQTVTRWKGQDDELAKDNDKMRFAIERAKIELREIRLTVDHLLQKKAAEETALRRRRHGRILRQVSAHLHELRYEIQSKFDALKHAQTQNQSMKAELALLEWQIKNECARAEMAGPDDVRKAVSEHFRKKLHALDLAECF
ncbi:hypothetical protein CSOJ01_01013 [Colletotrichum sojae]|uniref:Uncharacterized protein n=1 Tax=Colletotrichum sojae TaxID=2175907 RepID=A0A8H6JWA3_9PEZI|nr:hypothetical protein CSOJ01_01013 [Colletotrichum sojae]